MLITFPELTQVLYYQSNNKEKIFTSEELYFHMFFVTKMLLIRFLIH